MEVLMGQSYDDDDHDDGCLFGNGGKTGKTSNDRWRNDNPIKAKTVSHI